MATDNPAIVFVNFDGTEGSVFWSQMVEPLRAIQNASSYSVHMVILNRIDTFFSSANRLKASKKLEQCGFSTTLVPRFPYLSNIQLYFNLFFLYMGLRPVRTKRLILHARGPFSAFLSIAIRKVCPWLRIERILYDCRGDILAELREYGKHSWIWTKIRLWQLEHLERVVLSHVDHVNVVSRPLLEVLQRRYGYQGPASLTPSAVNIDLIRTSLTNSARLRSELNLQNRLVLVYSGSMLAWQMPDTLISLFTQFHAIEKRSFFLILTSEPEKIKPLLKRCGLENRDYLLKSVGPRELYSSISCGDLGLLLREANDTNRVASPTKFAEYLACGVPVLATQGIGDLDRTIEQENLGWLLPSMDQRALMKTKIESIVATLQSRSVERPRLQHRAHELYSIEQHVQRLLIAYGLTPNHSHE